MSFKRPRGDYSKLAKIIEMTGRVADGELARKSIQTIADTSKTLALEGARAGRNPQGRAWRKLKTGGIPLRSFASKIKLRVRLNEGFTLTVADEIAMVHQRGAKRRGTKWKLPARRTLPKGSLPKPWLAVIVPGLDKTFAAVTRT